MHLDSNITSIESDINTCICKACTAIDMLATIWKFDLFDKIERKFFLNCSCIRTTVWFCHFNSNETPEEKAGWELYKDAVCSFEQILETALFGHLPPFSQTI